MQPVCAHWWGTISCRMDIRSGHIPEENWPPLSLSHWAPIYPQLGWDFMHPSPVHTGNFVLLGLMQVLHTLVAASVRLCAQLIMPLQFPCFSWPLGYEVMSFLVFCLLAFSSSLADFSLLSLL